MKFVFNPLSAQFDVAPPATSEGATLPTSGSNGDLFFNTTTSTLYVYFNTWIAVGSAAVVETNEPVTNFYGTAKYQVSVYSSVSTYGDDNATYGTAMYS